MRNISPLLFTDFCQGEAFECNTDRLCIPSSRVCDGFVDCTGGEDEVACVKTSPSSCKEAWERGIRKTGKYVIGMVI